MPRRCIFCQERPGSREHVFPNWLNKVFPVDEDSEEQPEWARHRADVEGVTAQTWSAAAIASLTSRLFCHTCNTGWMADLETKAHPLLTPMMTGHPVVMTALDQLIVATWATKTVMAIEPSITTGEENFPPAMCRIVKEQGRPPGSVEVSLAAVEGPIPPMGFSCARVHLQVNESPFRDYHFYTVFFGTLVIQVLRPDPPPADYGTLERMAVPREIEVPPDVARVIFPPTTTCRWPPEKVFDWDGVVEFTHRGLPMPEEWEPPGSIEGT